MVNEKISYASAFLNKAKSELKLAKIAIKYSNYSESVFLSQQASEKVAKAFLILHDLKVFEYKVSSDLNEVINKYLYDDLSKIPKLLLELEEHWIKSKYPLKKYDSIFDPLKYYTKPIALDNYKKAVIVYDSLIKFMNHKFDLKFKD